METVDLARTDLVVVDSVESWLKVVDSVDMVGMVAVDSVGNSTKVVNLAIDLVVNSVVIVFPFDISRSPDKVA